MKKDKMQHKIQIVGRNKLHLEDFLMSTFLLFFCVLGFCFCSYTYNHVKLLSFQNPVMYKQDLKIHC
jgi:hypothetical protein